MKTRYIMKSNFCVCCGREIPEGSLICSICDKIPVSEFADYIKHERNEKNKSKENDKHGF